MCRVWIVVVLILYTTALGFSQRPAIPEKSEIPKKGSITGIIWDKDSNQPVEYASIALYSARDSSLITGVVTGPDGKFILKNLNFGRYYMTIKFIGYNPEEVNDIMLTPENKIKDAGKIFLKQASVELSSVDVVANKASIIYKIDKKIVNPAQFPTAAGGTAVDVLGQTPSVTVDVEGNVSLRGSSSFTVLIDGRPSPFEGSEALQQIPTSSIENIEIITNPSAKYDPEGTAGIINIISKKSKLVGMTGIINSTVGNYDNYGGNFLLNYRTSKFNVYAGADYNHRNHPGFRSNENITYFEDTARYVYSEGDGSFLRETRSIKTGIDLFLGEKTTISSAITIGERRMDRTGELTYEEWTVPAGEHNDYTGENGFSRSGNFFNANAALNHKFNNRGHGLKLDGFYSNSKMDEGSFSTQYENSTISIGQKSDGIEDETEWRLKVDYTLPVNEKYKLEAGWQSRIETEDADYLSSQRENGNWKVQDEYSYQSSSKINIHAAYTTFAAELGNWGIQGGLRAEQTNREIKNLGSGEVFTLNRWDFFPSVHTSYQISNALQAITSYTRRINRPRSHYLEPYENYMDAYNIRAGNPNLKPEYIDSYEIGLTQQMGESFFSTEAYYRITDNKIERTRYPYSETVMYNTHENVGKDYSLGVEAMLNIQPVKFWTLNLSGNLYHYKVEGVLYGNSFEEESYNWSSRIGNTFTIDATTRFQIDGMYHSKSVTAQGERKAFFMTNAAVKKEFFNRKLTATLQARDLLKTMTHNIISESPSYKSTMKFDRSSPMIQLSLSLKINNYNTKEREREENGEEGENGYGF